MMAESGAPAQSGCLLFAYGALVYAAARAVYARDYFDAFRLPLF